MNQLLYVVDVQDSFSPPPWLIEGIRSVVDTMPSVATIEHYDEAVVPFLAQVNWSPNPYDQSLIPANQVLVKYGYNPPVELINPPRL